MRISKLCPRGRGPGVLARHTTYLGAKSGPAASIWATIAISALLCLREKEAALEAEWCSSIAECLVPGYQPILTLLGNSQKWHVVHRVCRKHYVVDPMCPVIILFWSPQHGLTARMTSYVRYPSSRQAVPSHINSSITITSGQFDERPFKFCRQTL